MNQSHRIARDNGFVDAYKATTGIEPVAAGLRAAHVTLSAYLAERSEETL